MASSSEAAAIGQQRGGNHVGSRCSWDGKRGTIASNNQGWITINVNAFDGGGQERVRGIDKLQLLHAEGLGAPQKPHTPASAQDVGDILEPPRRRAPSVPANVGGGRLAAGGIAARPRAMRSGGPHADVRDEDVGAGPKELTVDAARYRGCTAPYDRGNVTSGGIDVLSQTPSARKSGFILEKGRASSVAERRRWNVDSREAFWQALKSHRENQNLNELKRACVKEGLWSGHNTWDLQLRLVKHEYDPDLNTACERICAEDCFESAQTDGTRKKDGKQRWTEPPSFEAARSLIGRRVAIRRNLARGVQTKSRHHCGTLTE